MTWPFREKESDDDERKSNCVRPRKGSVPDRNNRDRVLATVETKDMGPAHSPGVITDIPDSSANDDVSSIDNR